MKLLFHTTTCRTEYVFFPLKQLFVYSHVLLVTVWPPATRDLTLARPPHFRNADAATAPALMQLETCLKVGLLCEKCYALINIIAHRLCTACASQYCGSNPLLSSVLVDSYSSRVKGKQTPICFLIIAQIWCVY